MKYFIFICIVFVFQVIRSTLTDKREKYYNSKGIGCYMFRVDDNLVVDATMKGNAARFINHSCDVSIRFIIPLNHFINCVLFVCSQIVIRALSIYWVTNIYLYLLYEKSYKVKN